MSINIFVVRSKIDKTRIYSNVFSFLLLITNHSNEQLVNTETPNPYSCGQPVNCKQGSVQFFQKLRKNVKRIWTSVHLSRYSAAQQGPAFSITKLVGPLYTPGGFDEVRKSVSHLDTSKVMMEVPGGMCPLLKDPLAYEPDTIDLINDPTERDYWFKCLRDMVYKFINKAGVLNPDYPEATEVAERCFKRFSNLIEDLCKDPSILNPLSIRTLLEYNEQTLRENNFKDAWSNQKDQETMAALREFPDRIRELDSISEGKERWVEVARGALAGNVFDWGAKAVTDILEESSDFGLKQAIEMIQERPWFRDCLDLWVSHVEENPYALAVVFVDNAGVDFVLGMLPFVRELLKVKTKVILSANSSPALNDITHKELLMCLLRAAECCPLIKTSLLNNQLCAMENGQRGPCLDLGNLDEDLCDKMKSADLIVLEGMGRAVHTNLNAQFSVDSLKLAVLKNEWLARSLGAEQFSVIFEFVPVA